MHGGAPGVFGDLPAGSIGWLLIDKAGRVKPVKRVKRQGIRTLHFSFTYSGEAGEAGAVGVFDETMDSYPANELAALFGAPSAPLSGGRLTYVTDAVPWHL
jgi:hypothetical protein